MKFDPIPGVTWIALGHKCRQGKDMAARYIIEAYPELVQRFAFADALKCYARIQHGMTKKDGNLLQRVGQELREIDPDIWLRALYLTVDEIRPEVAIITDMRYSNEAEMVHDLGGYLIRIDRYRTDGSRYISDDRNPNHPSETQLDSWPCWNAVIRNHTLDTLRQQSLAVFRLVYEHGHPGKPLLRAWSPA